MSNNKALEYLMRGGFVARGIVYGIVGYLAFLAAVDRGGQTTGPRGALQQFLGEPFGQILLLIMAVGLAGYAAWRMVQGFSDTERRGSDASGVAVRIASAAAGLAYLSLAVFAFSLVFAFGSGGGSGDWTSRLMDDIWGRWLIGIVAAGLALGGGWNIYKGVTGSFVENFERTPQHLGIWYRLSQFGLSARGVTWLIIAGLLFTAIWQYDPTVDAGLGAALQTLQQQNYGSILLGVIALGLIAFAIFSFLAARYRKIPEARAA